MRGDDPSSRSARPFVVPVAQLRKEIGSSRSELRQGVIVQLAALGVAVPDDSPVIAEVALASYAGGIQVTGTVVAPWEGECRRCGGTVTGRVAAEVRERYVPTEHIAEDEDAYPLDGNELDLEPLARDAVLLELPLAPLCSEECLGLCPRCGANRNVTVCQCSPEIDPRWSALDSLRDPESGGLA